jgi:hypothetical protein
VRRHPSGRISGRVVLGSGQRPGHRGHRVHLRELARRRARRLLPRQLRPRLHQGTRPRGHRRGLRHPVQGEHQQHVQCVLQHGRRVGQLLRGRRGVPEHRLPCPTSSTTSTATW